MTKILVKLKKIVAKLKEINEKIDAWDDGDCHGCIYMYKDVYGHMCKYSAFIGEVQIKDGVCNKYTPKVANKGMDG